jgi:hypothetical protein
MHPHEEAPLAASVAASGALWRTQELNLARRPKCASPVNETERSAAPTDAQILPRHGGTVRVFGCWSDAAAASGVE